MDIAQDSWLHRSFIEPFSVWECTIKSTSTIEGGGKCCTLELFIQNSRAIPFWTDLDDMDDFPHTHMLLLKWENTSLRRNSSKDTSKMKNFLPWTMDLTVTICQHRGLPWLCVIISWVMLEQFAARPFLGEWCKNEETESKEDRREWGMYGERKKKRHRRKKERQCGLVPGS